jgi:carbonic anhydrase/acetyltransferase-like protein (isoleucine patch superfamily)
MPQIAELIDRVIHRVNINLKELSFDVGPYVREVVPLKQFSKFYAFYGLTPHHPLYFKFSHSSLAGSYFLGKCVADYALIYKSDIRGDELKNEGETFRYKDAEIPLHDNEMIRIKDSYLIKTLVHNYSHDPENPEEFLIRNTASLHYANIHGSPVEGCFLGPFSTTDLTTLHDCVIGTFAYVQVGELGYHQVESGKIWIRNGDQFEFIYTFPPEVLKSYIQMEPGGLPRGIFMDFVEGRKLDFEKVFEVVQHKAAVSVPRGACLSCYSVVKGKTKIHENVLVAQRAYLENACLGRGSNAQENCYIIDSHLEGNNVTAHGGKVIHTRLGEKVFVGFNSFLRGGPERPLIVGRESIIMPHTIIDLRESLEIPPGNLVWGYITGEMDLKRHSIPLSQLERVDGEYSLGGMHFKGSGKSFVESFRGRIEHILEANGAYSKGTLNRGHAQMNRDMSINTIQPYLKGRLKGFFPTIEIRP